METVYWQIIVYVMIFGGLIYTGYTLSYGYLPFEMTVENVQDWIRERKEKKKE
jgi:hypothetical protein